LEAIRSEAIKERDAIQKAKNVKEKQQVKVRKIRAYDASVEVAHKKDVKEKYVKEQSKLAKAKIQLQLEENQRERTKNAYPQVHNFSQVVNKSNQEIDRKARAREERRLASLTKTMKSDTILPPVVDQTVRRPSSATKKRPEGSAGSARSGGSGGGHDSFNALDRYQTMQLGYDSVNDDTAPL